MVARRQTLRGSPLQPTVLVATFTDPRPAPAPPFPCRRFEICTIPQGARSAAEGAGGVQRRLSAPYKYVGCFADEREMKVLKSPLWDDAMTAEVSVVVMYTC